MSQHRLGATVRRHFQDREGTMAQPSHYLFLTLALAGQVPRQDSAGSVVGQIQSDKGRPVVNALVRAVGSPLMARSDSQGRFNLRDLPPGPAHLRVYALGFEPVDTTLSFRRAERVVWNVVVRV